MNLTTPPIKILDRNAATEPAPASAPIDLTMADYRGRVIDLADYRGKSSVVLVFNRGLF